MDSQFIFSEDFVSSKILCSQLDAASVKMAPTVHPMRSGESSHYWDGAEICCSNGKTNVLQNDGELGPATVVHHPCAPVP